MKKLILIFALIPLMAFAQYGQRGASGGSTFYWSLTGQAQKTDSLRIIQGTNMTITQSGNTVTFNGAAGAGSTANVRANVGWTSNGTTAQDTLARVYLLDKSTIQFLVVDADNDSFKVMPQSLYYWVNKEGSTIMSAADTLGRIYAGTPGADYVSLDPTTADDPRIILGEDAATAGTTSIIRDGSANQTQFIETVAGGTSIFNNLLGVTTDGTNTLTPTANLHTKGGATVEALRASTTGTGVAATDGFEISVDASNHATLLNNETASLILGTAGANRLDIQTPNAGNNWNVLQNTAGSGATILLFTNTTTGSTLGSDGFDVGIGTDEAAYIVQREALPMYFYTSNALAQTIGASGQVGIGGTTLAQNARAKFNVLGRAANDTLAIFSNDGGGAIGDSTTQINSDGSLKIQGNMNISYAGGYLSIGSDAAGSNGIAILQGGSDDLYLGARLNYGITFRSNATKIGSFSSAGLFSAGGNFSQQAAMQIRQAATADTLFMARNDKNSTLDSTMMVFANGSGYFGGNNLYQGGHRWRSNAAGDSLILYDGNTMIMAFLSDGTIADLVAGTPPTSRRYIPPPDYIWLLRIGVLLLLLLVAFKVHDYLKPFIRKHKTLPGEI